MSQSILPITEIDVHELVEEHDKFRRLFRNGEVFRPNQLAPRPEWHGKRAELLGVFAPVNGDLYAAIRFDGMGRYAYWIVKPEILKNVQRNPD